MSDVIPESAGRPVVDVVVLTWNDGELLDAAIESVLASEGIEVRLVVIDNASDPPARVPRDERVALVRNERNRGVAAGRNQGAGVGNAEYLAFVDSDAEVLPDTLRVLAAPLEQDERLAVAVPVFVGQAPTDSAGRAPTPTVKLKRALNLRSDYEPLQPPIGASWEVDFGIGACQFIRRSAFDDVIGLDESIQFGPEDLDFCLRLKDKGWRVRQIRGALCVHPPRRRFRKPLTVRGLRHGWAVLRFYRRRLRVR